MGPCDITDHGIRHGSIVTGLACLLTLCGPRPAHAQMPEHPFQVGEPFPTIALPSLEDGRPASIADYRGQKLILHVFASW